MVEFVAGFPALVWRFAQPLLVVSSGPHGGGLGPRDWVLNATVPLDYDRDDPDVHVLELATALGLTGSGAGLLTAVDVREVVTTTDDGVEVHATTGLGGLPTWAAAAPPVAEPPRVGTINVVAFLPARLSDAALVNAVATVAEAKAQALFEAGVPGTGTCTDAVVLACPATGPAHPYGGPRSTYGSALARAAHSAIRQAL